MLELIDNYAKDIENGRLATKQEIDEMVAAKGFRDNWNGEGVNLNSTYEVVFRWGENTHRIQVEYL